MIWACNKHHQGIKKEASPKDTGFCPICDDDVIAKCGEINTWHWAHKSKRDCDEWYEPETQWHLDWKNKFPEEQQEFTMGKHRVDIRTNTRWIIELQNSNISPEKIKEREDYYKRMIWLLNGESLANGLILRKKKGIITFRWKHPPKSWWYATKPIYIDLEEKYEGVEIFLVKKVHNNIPCGGWGELISKEEFLRRFTK